MEVKELTLEEIRQTVADMRDDAAQKRKTADRYRRDNQLSRAFMLTGEAIVIEHWVNRLNNALTHVK